jgi:hypothetical protein
LAYGLLRCTLRAGILEEIGIMHHLGGETGEYRGTVAGLIAFENPRQLELA